jgi:threonine/homoserine/homoserine lactone efflux protein
MKIGDTWITIIGIILIVIIMFVILGIFDWLFPNYYKEHPNFAQGYVNIIFGVVITFVGSRYIWKAFKKKKETVKQD